MTGYNCGFPSFGLSHPGYAYGAGNSGYGTGGGFGFGGIFMIIIVIFILFAIFLPVMIGRPIDKRH